MAKSLENATNNQNINLKRCISNVHRPRKALGVVSHYRTDRKAEGGRRKAENDIDDENLKLFQDPAGVLSGRRGRHSPSAVRVLMSLRPPRSLARDAKKDSSYGGRTHESIHLVEE
jgi:hypothetical protein